jgi:hypothetical protein
MKLAGKIWVLVCLLALGSACFFHSSVIAADSSQGLKFWQIVKRDFAIGIWIIPGF